MQFRALAKHIRVSPYKLRPIAQLVRGRRVDTALAQLQVTPHRRMRPLSKTIYSAYSNARQVDKDLEMSDLVIKELRIDQGMTYKYHKPTAMGRASIQRKRLSHIMVVLEKRTSDNTHKEG